MSTPIARHADGSNCYTKNCSLGRHTAIQKETTAFTEFQKDIVNNSNAIQDLIKEETTQKVNELAKQANEYACNNAIRNVNQIPDIGKEAYSPILAIKRCPEHNTIHILNKKKYQDVIGQMRKAHQFVPDTLSSDKKEELHGHVRNTIFESLKPFRADEKALKEWQKQVERSPLHKIALLHKDKGLQTEEQRQHKKQKTIAKLESNSKLLIPASKVSQEHLMHYYECFRKIQHPTVEQAEVAVKSHQEKKQDYNMTSYLCSHCKNYHIGHGNGTTGSGYLHSRASQHWNTNASEANNFARKVLGITEPVTR